MSEPQGAAAEVAAAEEAERPVPDRVLHAVSGRTAVGPAEIPTPLLIAIVFITGLVLGGIAVAVWLLRHGPDPDAAAVRQPPHGPDPIEAELQEIIAESMARELLEPGTSDALGDQGPKLPR